jgi:NADH-quinone oxidoreductase subunit N
MLQIPTIAELHLLPVVPAMIVAVGMCFLLLIDLWVSEDEKSRTAWMAQGILVTAFVVNLFTFGAEGEALSGMFVGGAVTAFLNMVVLVATFVAILMSVDYLQRTKIEKGEFYPLILFSAAGAMFMASANDLVMIFVALELLSIPLYVMAAFRYPTAADKANPQLEKMGQRSEESGLKYFILGAFASAFFVYGAALIYGGSGSTNLTAIFGTVEAMVAGTAPLAASPWLLVFGTGMILVALGFKIALFPFHMWTPDVYEGAPTNVTAYMSIAAKVGGVAALARILATGVPSLFVNGAENAAWQLAVGVVALLTMVLGNFVAIQQTNIKRMLAYSSIAHGGYMLVGIAAAGSAMVSANTVLTSVAIYLFAYTFTNLGAFAVVMALEKNDGTGTELDDFTGLSKSQPMMAAMMALFMLSLVGMPATGGFIGKYFVFAAAVNAELYLLASVGILTSVASVYYYMRVIMKMYLEEDAEGDPAEGATPYLNWALYISAAGVLITGVAPALATGLINNVQAIVPLF